MSAAVSRSRWAQFVHLTRALGPRHALRYKWKQRRHRGPYELTSQHAAFPLWVRPDTSDQAVFWQVFIGLEYACVTSPNPPRYIIDCGANVGYTAAYFLTKFPSARVVAVEPDPGNAEMCRRNLAPYGDRAYVLEAGIWSHRAGLVISETPFRDGREWARQVREVGRFEQAAFSGVPMASLVGDDHVDILKMDIEGAETLAFRDPRWLHTVDTFAVELHGVEARAAFARAVPTPPFHISTHGELTLARR